jgi:hypothetical protein
MTRLVLAALVLLDCASFPTKLFAQTSQTAPRVPLTAPGACRCSAVTSVTGRTITICKCPRPARNPLQLDHLAARRHPHGVPMKVLLAAVLVALAAPVGCAAEQLPAEYLGKWCPVPNAGGVYERVQQTDCDDGMTLTAAGERTRDCQTVRVRAVEKGFMISYRCVEQSKYLTVERHLHVIGSRLIMYPVEE